MPIEFPRLDLDRETIEWMTLDDGAEALVVNGGGFDGGDGAFFALAGEDSDDLHAYAPFALSPRAWAASGSGRTVVGISLALFPIRWRSSQARDTERAMSQENVEILRTAYPQAAARGVDCDGVTLAAIAAARLGIGTGTGNGVGACR